MCCVGFCEALCRTRAWWSLMWLWRLKYYRSRLSKVYQIIVSRLWLGLRFRQSCLPYSIRENNTTDVSVPFPHLKSGLWWWWRLLLCKPCTFTTCHPSFHIFINPPWQLHLVCRRDSNAHSAVGCHMVASNGNRHLMFSSLQLMCLCWHSHNKQDFSVNEHVSQHFTPMDLFDPF